MPRELVPWRCEDARLRGLPCALPGSCTRAHGSSCWAWTLVSEDDQRAPCIYEAKVHLPWGVGAQRVAEVQGPSPAMKPGMAFGPEWVGVGRLPR